VIEQYDDYLGDTVAEMLTTRSFAFAHGNVIIKATPDLHLRTSKRETLVKLWLPEDEPSALEIKVLTQCLFEAASAAGLTIPSSAVQLVDVARGEAHAGARMGSRMRAQILAALEAVEARWVTLPPPLGRRRA
jgi:hypothetical protein